MKQIRSIINVLIIILVIEIIVQFFLPKWTFRYRTLVYINYVIQSTSFFGIIMCLLVLKIKDTLILVILNLFVLSICLTSSYIAICPIDTYGEPTDVSCLKTESKYKTMVTEKISGKTGQSKFDTITVRDIWIFRKVCKKSQ